jgi:mannitol-1-phosphate 5-dehydrogenase
MKKSFVGFGFGAIQAGLFLYEAHASGKFDRFVVAEVLPEVVDAVRQSGGRYGVNIAGAQGIEKKEITGITILNPNDPADREALVAAVADADELACALPSVRFYETGGAASVVNVLADGFALRRSRGGTRRSIIYAAENHNHAAEILEALLTARLAVPAATLRTQVQCLNTVIGKMSGIVTDEAQIADQGLARLTGATGRCVLVEAFNHILITRIAWSDFPRGIPIFIEKDDLLPFEEAKLYGHNATHALMGYLARAQGYNTIADVRRDPRIPDLARAAFLQESGAALIEKYHGFDRLFTVAGYRDYAEDLLGRMMNPHLRDLVERVVRDPRRKLGWDDRLVGTMRLALGQGITPRYYALGARSALAMLKESEPGQDEGQLLDTLWAGVDDAAREKQTVKTLILNSRL